MFSASALSGVRLRKVAPVEVDEAAETARLAAAVAAEKRAAEEEPARRTEFFAAGVSNWYSEAPLATFRTSFVPISQAAARAIVSFFDLHEGQWRDGAVEPPALASPLPSDLLVTGLGEEVGRVIAEQYGGVAFIKLTTRSPKDSRIVLSRAAAALHTLPPPGPCEETPEQHDNRLLVAFTTALAAALPVRGEDAASCGDAALRLLCDSERVAEDLRYALEQPPDLYDVSVCVREFDAGITPASEFRGFVWDGKLNCIGQYYHVLHFPGLAEVRERVGADCLAFFATIKSALPRRCMLDLAWLGDGRVVLIEANAFDGVYGSFPASTGLFSWEEDRALLTGVGGTFEVRVREGPAPRAELLASMSPSWRRILLEK